jgi:hypothetical protein
MSEALLTGESLETPNQHIEYLKKNEYKYRRFFKDYESYETFMMLPVAESDRASLLQKLHEEERRKLGQIMPTTVVYGAV